MINKNSRSLRTSRSPFNKDRKVVWVHLCQLCLKHSGQVYCACVIPAKTDANNYKSVLSCSRIFYFEAKTTEIERQLCAHNLIVVVHQFLCVVVFYVRFSHKLLKISMQ